MAQRRFHYEQAFEHYLRATRTPYIAVDEAKKALVPETADRRAVHQVLRLRRLRRLTGSCWWT
jgi:hypothetical protein